MKSNSYFMCNIRDALQIEQHMCSSIVCNSICHIINFNRRHYRLLVSVFVEIEEHFAVTLHQIRYIWIHFKPRYIHYYASGFLHNFLGELFISRPRIYQSGSRETVKKNNINGMQQLYLEVKIHEGIDRWFHIRFHLE